MARKSSLPAGGIYPKGFASRTDWPWPLVRSEDIVSLNYGKALSGSQAANGANTCIRHKWSMWLAR